MELFKNAGEDQCDKYVQSNIYVQVRGERMEGSMAEARLGS